MDEDGYHSDATPSSEEDGGDSSSVISVSSTDKEREFQREARIRQRHIERIEFEKQQQLEKHEKKEVLRAEHRRQMIGELPFGLYPGSQLVTPIDPRMLQNQQQHDDDDDDEDYDDEYHQGAARGVGVEQRHQRPFGDSQEGFLNSTGTGSIMSGSIPTQKMSKKKKAAMLAVAALAKKKKQQEEEGLNAQQYEAISVAQYALKEASRHAISLQDMLVEIHTQLEDQESERLRVQHRIETQIDEGVKMDSTVANRKLKHEDQLQTLKSRIAYLEQETMTDRDEKLRLLKIIDMYVNGGPTPTLSDWSFHHYINTVGQISSNPQLSSDALTPAATAEHRAQFTANSASNAAVSFAKIIGSLPETNRDLLEKQRMFDFSNQVINNVIVQYRRSRVVSAERGVIAGAVAVGLNVKLVELLSHVSADDLVKL
jgi:urease gamma subunit